jgi:signal transduction histidine kinase
MKSRDSKALPLTITLGSVLLVFCLALTTLWNIVLIYDTLQLKAYAGPHLKRIWSQWIILGVGTALFVLIITGIILFIVFMSRQIIVNQLQKNFIDSMTHELKTPLTSLRLYVETLQRHRVDQHKQAWLLETMLRDIDHLDLLVSHVLEAVRVEYGRDQDSLEQVALYPLLAECVETIRRRYQLTADAIQLRGPELCLRSNSGALRLVFMNLLDNAVKYSGAQPCVTVMCEAAAAHGVRVSVQDSGPGIPVAELKKVFRRFYRLPGHENLKGSGLGLFIVKETLRQLKGRIQIRNLAEPQGCIFTVTLPAGERGHVAPRSEVSG